VRRMRQIFAGGEEAYRSAVVVVRCYYAGLLFMAALSLRDWPGYLARSEPMLLWPVAWVQWVQLRAGIAVILAGYLAGAFAAAVWPERRWARTLAFAGLLEFAAFENSFGKINHHLHLWVWTAAVFVALPRSGERLRFLLVLWSCRAVVLLSYSMSGLGKVAGALAQIWAGQPHALLPDALARIVADRLLQTGSESLLGPWLIEQAWVGWPLMLGAMAVQLPAFAVAFWPRLWRWWGAMLIVFHLGTYFLLTIGFAQNVLLLALLFLAGQPKRCGNRCGCWS
jgi:hypothetical protein